MGNVNAALNLVNSLLNKVYTVHVYTMYMYVCIYNVHACMYIHVHFMNTLYTLYSVHCTVYMHMYTIYVMCHLCDNHINFMISVLCMTLSVHSEECRR